MIKLQDFARRQGVTDRAIQKLIKKYDDELTGLYQRKGPNGTWLTDEACEIIRSKMRMAPTAVIEKDGRVKDLEDRVRDLEKKLNEKDAMLTMAQQATAEAQAQAKGLLDAAEKVKLLEASETALKGERDRAEAKAKEASEAAQRAQGELAAVRSELADRKAHPWRYLFKRKEG